MTLVYLVRHAETEGMASKGAIKSDQLTPRGKKQARALAQRFSHLRLDAIYSSIQHRAHETAKLVKKKHARVPFVVTRELREIYAPLIGGPPKYGTPPERLSTDRARAERVFKRFFKPGKKHILLVCHGNLIRYLLARAFRRNLRKVPLATFPTSVSIVWIKRWKGKTMMWIFCVNNIKHLSSNLAQGHDFPSINLL